MRALAFEFVGGTVLSSVGIPGLMPIPVRATLVAFAYSFGFSLWVNDTLKVALIGKVKSA